MAQDAGSEEASQAGAAADPETDAVQFACPQCGTAAVVSQVQGDRCPGCHFEFKWFAAGEERTAQDYLLVLTRQKHFLALPDGQGFIVAHE
jgi:predicted RNA-binding Zn-ribbon protein involved in translation (DUF1610 family)